ncbi:hypothetical protein [Agrococcus sp. SCSIO52902]|uniref:hypothetical protein n=1 Tax=Agrococcus sp. SCSIO52902 TaxID=2933290 RepID=UPI001FF2B487|nr:hypothetical protein [Agrococcus sp. SCSIO52902]UOW00828.1 hypothetical protein MU522_13125 [Agrococcus sp. SCSIO52902]UOW00891.1 hypothetical protein MU522_00210 [Agrococcus sp. SCSIO52902]
MFNPNDYNDLDEARLFARATTCSVEGCDGASHCVFEGEAEWRHVIGEGSLGCLEWEMSVSEGLARVDLLERGHAVLTSASLRELADALAEAPARLRSMADELERRNS